MDGPRFDHVTRALSDETPRRGVFGLLLGGALGLAGLAESAAKGKKKKKGKGKKKKKSNFCVETEKSCAGNCTVGQACCSDFDCDDCRALFCSNRTPGTPGVCGCTDGDEMYKGRCGHKPVCIPAGQKREMEDARCCSGQEVTDINDPENGKCLPGTLSCLSDADCTGGDCRGYQCYAFELGCTQF